MYARKEKIYPAYISKHNSNPEKQVILLIIPNEKKGHYLAIKKLSALLIGVTSKHHGNFYCLNCRHSFVTENKLQSHKKSMQKKKDFYNITMPSEDTKINFVYNKSKQTYSIRFFNV